MFTTNTESHKTDELAADASTNVSFCDGSGQWASFAGDAAVDAGRGAVARYYGPALRAWLGDLGDGVRDGSERDPRIGVIRVRTRSVTYALTDKTVLGRAVEVARGTLTGEVAGVNRLREISEDEVLRWRSDSSRRG